MTESASTVVKMESEADKAARHKKALNQVLAPVVEACEAARRDGFLVEYQVGLSQFGVYSLTVPPCLVKRY